MASVSPFGLEKNKILVPEAGFEPAHSFERHPLKMVCLPSSTTPAFYGLSAEPSSAAGSESCSVSGSSAGAVDGSIGDSTGTSSGKAIPSRTVPLEPRVNMMASVSEVTIKMTAHTVVALVRTVAAPRAPKAA